MFTTDDWLHRSTYNLLVAVQSSYVSFTKSCESRITLVCNGGFLKTGSPETPENVELPR